jgi:hypothetical protein
VPSQRKTHFGLRNSGFFRISGLRIPDLRFPAPPSCVSEKQEIAQNPPFVFLRTGPFSKSVPCSRRDCDNSAGFKGGCGTTDPATTSPQAWSHNGKRQPQPQKCGRSRTVPLPKTYGTAKYAVCANRHSSSPFCSCISRGSRSKNLPKRGFGTSHVVPLPRGPVLRNLPMNLRQSSLIKPNKARKLEPPLAGACGCVPPGRGSAGNAADQPDAPYPAYRCRARQPSTAGPEPTELPRMTWMARRKTPAKVRVTMRMRMILPLRASVPRWFTLPDLPPPQFVPPQPGAGAPPSAFCFCPAGVRPVLISASPFHPGKSGQIRPYRTRTAHEANPSSP